MSGRHTALGRLGTSAALALTATLALGACGSSSPERGSDAPVQSAQDVRPLQATHNAGRGHDRASGRRVERHGSSGTGQVRRSGPVRARSQPGLINDEVSSTAAKPIDPCTLVSRAQAEAILEGPVAAPVSAPQGPTCLYMPRRAGAIITLSLHSRIGSARPQAQLAHRMPLHVDGRKAYCGVSGAPQLIVAVSGDRLMRISAPCPIAAAFAAKALTRIPKPHPGR